MTTKFSNGNQLSFLFSLLFWIPCCWLLGFTELHLFPWFGLPPCFGSLGLVFIRFYLCVCNPLGVGLCFFFVSAPFWMLSIRSSFFLSCWLWYFLLSNFVCVVLMFSFFGMGSKLAPLPRLHPLVQFLHDELLSQLYLNGQVFVPFLFSAGTWPWFAISTLSGLFCLVLVSIYYSSLLDSTVCKIQELVVSPQRDFCFELLPFCLLILVSLHRACLSYFASHNVWIGYHLPNVSDPVCSLIMLSRSCLLYTSPSPRD